MKELVSVIVPVYNVEAYVDLCLKSIVSQSYDTLEIIVVDDGSTDSSGEKCDEWAKSDSRIKVIHQQNKGLSGARNAAIDVCTGMWITFVDSDDEISERYVETLLNLVKTYDVKIAQCLSRKNVSEKGMEGDIVKGIMNSSAFLLSEKYRTMAWGKMYHRILFEEERYPLGKIHEDMALTYKLVYEAGKIAYTSEKLYLYNSRLDSIISKDGFYLRRLDILQFRKEQVEFYKEKQEVLLTEKALRDYAYELLECYSKTRKKLKRFDVAKQIHEEYRKIWNDLKQDRVISMKVKVLLGFCYYFPSLWSVMTCLGD